MDITKVLNWLDEIESLDENSSQSENENNLLTSDVIEEPTYHALQNVATTSNSIVSDGKPTIYSSNIATSTTTSSDYIPSGSESSSDHFSDSSLNKCDDLTNTVATPVQSRAHTRGRGMRMRRGFRGRTIHTKNVPPNNTSTFPINQHLQNNTQLNNIDGININWMNISGQKFKQFPYTGNTEIHSDISNKLNLRASDVYRFIVDDELLNLIVSMTNENAKTKKPHWKDVDLDELLNFFTIMLYMGLVKYPTIADYWANSFLYKNEFVKSVMPRDRFKDILRFFHIQNNATADITDRIYKIRPLVNILNNNFEKLKTPGETVAIDESMVPFRGRLVFKQYLPGKSSKYGVKIFKLCDSSGYTFKSIVYEGKMKNPGLSDERVSNTVVKNLMHSYLNTGRTLVADNYYNNMRIAEDLLNQNTHLVGTLRKNVKHTPKNVMKDDKKMKKGDIIGMENDNGIVIGHWKDKRSVRFITTKHTVNIIDTGKKNRLGENVKKPEAILFYNRFKQGVDISDQMSSYHSVLRKTIRWYHKVAFEFLFGTAVVNAWNVYKSVTNNSNMQIKKFRENLIRELLSDVISSKLSTPSVSPKFVKRPHNLIEMEGKSGNSNRKKRRRCVGCYENLRLTLGPTESKKKCKMVSTICQDCDKPYCLHCFQHKH